jgi:hypothetical protein
MVSGVEKKPPTVTGEGGASRASPDEAIEPGIGRSNASGPTVTGKGCTFPVGFRPAVKEPLIAVFPSACQAETNDWGSVSWIW